MTKYFLFAALLLLVFLEGHAQQPNQTNSQTAAQIKAATQAQSAFNSKTGGNMLTTGITSRIAQPLSLSVDQKRSFNTALFNFFNDKNGFAKLKWSDRTSYQQQLNTLIQKLTGQLEAFLSPDQVNKFVSMRPASPRTNDPLIMVFY
jgi:predicted outer membrane protein